MKKLSDLKPSTLAAHALGWRDPQTRGIVPPIDTSVPYERAPDGSYPGGRTYTRDHNPTYDPAEALLACLEEGAEALLFSSGMAAATTVFETLAVGSHVVVPRDMYWTIRAWLHERADSGRLSLDIVPTGDLDALRAAVRSGVTRVVWIETPSNPTCAVTDIAAAADIAHAAGAMLAVDGTIATPVLCQPLVLGADVVMHSATKQLNGHSDVLAGALVTKRDDEVWQQIKHDRAYRGAVLGPFEAWLLLRGMRTLYLRVMKASENAQGVAEALADHELVEEVLYPGLPDHPGHEVAGRQMRGGYGPMVSFRVGSFEEARRVVGALRLFRNATSLGGVESLAEHRAPVEGPDSPVAPDLIRLSLGIEDLSDLVADLQRALGRD